ncbi:hypothetical protein J1N35_008430 [Gossypium stocksii]|uniref:Uncharacterized protein n=1 Tax=Gossypium stocksii TaxID=47602 RepID=A0A9D3W9E0_9ROSI|nr:hypothetical protein J1N35_008430 [Gossypium stocksii]
MDTCGSVQELETPDEGICSNTPGLCLLSPVLEINEKDCPLDDKIDHSEEEETFFDSQAWLRSDCEDEVSINPWEEPPPALEEKKELVELLEDPFWSDLLIQHPTKVVSIYRDNIQLVRFFQDCSWTSKQSFKNHSIVKPSILVKVPKEFNGLSKSRNNSLHGKERVQKNKSNSKEKSFCCIPVV